MNTPPEQDAAAILPFSVDDLAQEIRRVDGSHSLGAAALAEALSPFLARAWASGQQREEAEVRPYAYEFGRDNGDGTYSVVIERGDMVRVGPRRWESVPPQRTHKDHQVKALYLGPMPQARQQETK